MFFHIWKRLVHAWNYVTFKQDGLEQTCPRQGNGFSKRSQGVTWAHNPRWADLSFYHLSKKDSQWLLSIPVPALCGIWMQRHDCCKPTGGIRYKNTNLGVDSADILLAETKKQPSSLKLGPLNRAKSIRAARILVLGWLDPLRSHVFPVVNLCGKPCSGKPKLTHPLCELLLLNLPRTPRNLWHMLQAARQSYIPTCALHFEQACGFSQFNATLSWCRHVSRDHLFHQQLSC